ncbi:MAG: hypothetical protein KDJ35_03675 [Alphaproteobacteria bacterium]|nr:hypothetical protein [Alphaproteobacteria bacterium]
MKIEKTFAAATLGLLTSAFVSAQEIKVTNPSGEVKTFDCSCLHQESGKLWMSGEAVEKIDALYSGQQIKRTGLAYKKDLSSDPRERGNQLSNNQYQLVNHISRFHNDCISLTARFEMRVAQQNGRTFNADGVYGDGWENKTACMVKDINRQCRDALGLK